MRKRFDIREHISETQAADPMKRRTFIIINCYMNAIGHFSFMTLLNSRVGEILGHIENSIIGIKGSGEGQELSAVLAAVRDLRVLSGDLTGQQLFLLRGENQAKVIQAARRLRQLWIPIPLTLARRSAREEYFAELVLYRTLSVLGEFTPRDLFERNLVDLSELEKSVLLEAKMVGLILGCAPKNNMAAMVDKDSGLCKCVPQQSANCVQSTTGRCAAGSDIAKPQVIPNPGGSNNL